ncbi:MAG: hypothetical protein ACK5RG_19145 [Cyclobacteriaceae bacterium]|jgi:hypothetical protein
MRQLLLGLLFLGTISCLTNKKTTRDFTFHVDSAFVESFSTKDLQEISNISNFKIKEDQSFFKHALDQFSFYDFQTQNLLDTIDIKIVLAKPKYPIVYDGELKIVYLMTVGRSGKQIDVLRVGKTEGIPGFSVLETSLIENDLVKRKFKESTLNDETVDVIRKLRSETFKITKEGKIKLQPT